MGCLVSALGQTGGWGRFGGGLGGRGVLGVPLPPRQGVTCCRSTAPALHGGHPDAAVPGAGGAAGGRLRAPRRHLEHRLHGEGALPHSVPHSPTARPTAAHCPAPHRPLSWRRAITSSSPTRGRTTAGTRVGVAGGVAFVGGVVLRGWGLRGWGIVQPMLAHWGGGWSRVGGAACSGWG